MCSLADSFSASVRKVNGKWTFSNGVDQSAVAYGTISVAINETGWNILKVKSNEEFSNEDQSYAAGLIEGYLSQDMIYTHSKNIYGEKQPSKHVCMYFCPYRSDPINFG